MNSAGASGALPVALVTSGLVLWLAADRGVTESNGGVSLWEDQSGQSANATQPDDDARPRVRSGNGGPPMIEFDGENDSFVLADGFEDFSDGLTAFIVAEPLEAAGDCASMLHLSNGSEIQDVDFGLSGNTIQYEVDAVWFDGMQDSFEFGDRILAGFSHETSGRAELRMNGEYLFQQDLELPEVAVRYDNTVGRSLYSCPTLRGRIGEILLYARALAAAERVLVETYLRARWF